MKSNSHFNVKKFQSQIYIQTDTKLQLSFEIQI